MAYSPLIFKMAPAKKKIVAAVVPPFADADIEEIKCSEDFDVTKNGETFRIPVPKHSNLQRTYKLDNGDLHYVHTYEVNDVNSDDEDDVVPDPFLKPEKGGKKGKAATAVVKEDNLEMEKPIAEKAKPSKAETKPVKAAPKPKEPEPEPEPEPESESESEEESEEDEVIKEVVKPKAKRQVKPPVNLNDVLAMIEGLKIIEAKTTLESYITKFGAEGKKKRQPRPADKPMAAYHKFLSEEMGRISARENEKPKEERIPSKERLVMAVMAWKEHKKTLA